jgi:starvation-inducible outer membrane lipoprotein
LIRRPDLKTALLAAAALLGAALMLSACQSAPDGASGDPEKYRRDHDNYVRTIEPKTGRPDL